MSRKHFIHVLKFPDGRFLCQHHDYADQFTSDPLSATNMSVYSTENDTNEYQNRGAILVQYEITATPTGVTCADIFKEERERLARHWEECRQAEAEAVRAREATEAEESRLLALTLGIEPLPRPCTDAKPTRCEHGIRWPWACEDCDRPSTDAGGEHG